MCMSSRSAFAVILCMSPSLQGRCACDRLPCWWWAPAVWAALPSCTWLQPALAALALWTGAAVPHLAQPELFPICILPWFSLNLRVPGVAGDPYLHVCRDAVELSNIHRQVAHTEASVGRHKAGSAAAAARAINSAIQVLWQLQLCAPSPPQCAVFERCWSAQTCGPAASLCPENEQDQTHASAGRGAQGWPHTMQRPELGATVRHHHRRERQCANTVLPLADSHHMHECSREPLYPGARALPAMGSHAHLHTGAGTWPAMPASLRASRWCQAQRLAPTAS
jgi:ThiF family